MQSKAATVKEYLASLPEDRRSAISAVRDVILKNIDKQYGEGMLYGMITYFVPHSIFPAGYHCDPSIPLPFAGLASQKNHMSLYMSGDCCIAPDARGAPPSEAAKRFRSEWAKTGKKLDMGKSCIRFKKVEDLALDVIAEAIKSLPVKTYVKQYEAGMAANAARKSKGQAKTNAKAMAKRAEPKKVVKKKVAKKKGR